MTKGLITLIACALIIGAAMGCSKKEDPALAELNARLQAMEAELDKARSGNASAEEIAQLETAIAQTAEQEQRTERRREGRRNRDETPAPASTPTTTTPTASTTQTPAASVATTAPAASVSTTTAPVQTAAASTSTPTSTAGFQMSGTTGITKYTGTSASVIIPNGVTFIGNGTFTDNKNVTSVTIPNSVTFIAAQSFYRSGITSITMPDSFTEIGQAAFAGCTSLTSVTIGSGVTAGIGGGAFGGCTSLTSITVDNRNTTYSSIDGVLFNKNKTVLLEYPIGKQNTSYTIPSSVTEIGNNAFAGCTNLTSVTIPDSVTSIGMNAFGGYGPSCENLTSVTFQGRITSWTGEGGRAYYPPFTGDLKEKYIEGGPGTYRRQPGSNEWERQAVGA
jgi:TolA-binding protein